MALSFLDINGSRRLKEKIIESVENTFGNAEENQNSFSNVMVDTDTIYANSKTDTLNIEAGANISLTSDTQGKKITISSQDTIYTHPASGINGGTYSSVTVDENGHVTSGDNPIIQPDKGGTGQTTLKNSCLEMINSLSTGTTAPADNDYFVAQKTNGGTTNVNYYRKPMTALWDYIKGKIEIVLGLSTSSLNIGTKSGSTTGNRSIVVGFNSVAEGRSAAALGSETKSLANCSFTAGYKTTANYYAATALGNQQTSIGDSSYSQGYSTNVAPTDITSDTPDDEILAQWETANFSLAKGAYSHVEGWDNVALGFCSHVEGRGNVAFDYQHIIGGYNDYNIDKEATKFAIGNGTNDARTNAFRITRQGATYAKGAYNSTGADYAEFSEWADGNHDNEDRRGYFVTFDEAKPNMIRKANAGDYILGIVSGNPCIIGNSDEAWLGRYVFDEFGSIVYEEKEIEVEHTNPETGEVTTTKETVTTYKTNPDYDETKQYIHRKDRKEWATVGWIGVLSVRDDGTCVPGDYCTVSDGGISTASTTSSKNNYKVLERVSDSVIKVAFR